MEMMDRQSIWKWYTAVPTHCARRTWTSPVVICSSSCTAIILSTEMAVLLFGFEAFAVLSLFFSACHRREQYRTEQVIIIAIGLHWATQTTAFINKISLFIREC